MSAKNLIIIIVISLLLGVAYVVMKYKSQPQTMSPADIQEGAKEVAEEAVAMAKKDYGVTLDYSVASVEQVEKILGKIHEQHAKRPLTHEQLSRLSTSYGGYIGEVIRRKWGGHWEKDHPVAGPGSFPLNSQGHQSFPIGWCYKRLTNGPDDNVWFKLQVLYLQPNK